VRRKQPGFRRNKRIFVSGRHAISQRFVCKASFSNWKHLCVYSSVLAHCDFFLFPKIKSVLKGTHFVSVEQNRRAPEQSSRKWSAPFLLTLAISCAAALQLRRGRFRGRLKMIFWIISIKVVTASVALCLWRTSYSTFAKFVGCNLIVSFH